MEDFKESKVGDLSKSRLGKIYKRKFEKLTPEQQTKVMEETQSQLNELRESLLKVVKQLEVKQEDLKDFRREIQNMDVDGGFLGFSTVINFILGWTAGGVVSNKLLLEKQGMLLLGLGGVLGVALTLGGSALITRRPFTQLFSMINIKKLNNSKLKTTEAIEEIAKELEYYDSIHKQTEGLEA